MRFSIFLLMALALCAPSAHAQVSVNLNALDSLSAAPAPSPAPAPAPARPAGSSVLPPKPVGPLPLPPTPPEAPPVQSSTTITGSRIGPLPAPPPKSPPSPPVLAPVVVVGPPHPEPVPPPPSVAAGAPGAASAIPGGVRVTFGTDDADFNPATLDALRHLASSAASEHARSVSVDAYAAGDPSDPSTPRRLSLSRALAARAVLREAGIPSERIYVRALLADAAGGLPANRVDVTVATASKGSP